MKKGSLNKIPKETMDRIIEVGRVFDSLKNHAEMYNALIMLLTGVLIEEVNESRYEEFLDELKNDVIENVKEVEKRMKSGEFPMDFPPTEGNA